jgi:hypothetical protein
VLLANLSDRPITDLTVSLATGPLCGEVETVVHRLQPSPAGDGPGIEPVVINESGGLSPWMVGSLEPHQDLVIELVP